MNKNWKREILIFVVLCVSIEVIGFGISLLCHTHMRIPFIIKFVIECVITTLIEHNLEEKERKLIR